MAEDFERKIAPRETRESSFEAPEKQAEQGTELEPIQPERQEQKALPEIPQASTAHTEVTEPKTQVQRAIEDILSEDLTDVYLSLPAEARPAFKIKGEEIAEEIAQMVEKGKVKARKILGMVIDWLRMIPGLNKFYLEQEAKIKTDKLLQYVREHSGV